MKKNKNIIIMLIVIVIVILIIISFLKIKTKDKNKEHIENSSFINEENRNIINELKEEVNASGNTDIYDVKSEYDGRKILQIKPNIQFDTVLAGIIKNSIFTEEEMKTLLQERPQHNGIWISKNSKENFLKLLKDNGIDNFDIDDNGYLQIKQKNTDLKEKNKIIENAIKSDNLYIIDMSGTSYIRDEISGEIVEYPFEKMAPHQILDIYNNEKATIIEVTTNKNNKISQEEILEEILQNIS